MSGAVTVTALLPCPFCGGEARLWPVIMPFDADCDSITVQCGECDVIGADVLVDQDVHYASDLPDLEAQAIAAWNTRHAAEAASKQQIAELVDALLEARAGLVAFAYDACTDTIVKIDAARAKASEQGEAHA